MNQEGGPFLWTETAWGFGRIRGSEAVRAERHTQTATDVFSSFFEDRHPKHPKTKQMFQVYFLFN